MGRLGLSWWVGSVILGGSALRIFHGSTVQVERIEDSASAGLTCLDASMESSSPSDRDGFDVGVTRKHRPNTISGHFEVDLPRISSTQTDSIVS